MKVGRNGFSKAFAADAFRENSEDIKTLVDPTAGGIARDRAASLVFDLVSPVGISEIEAGAKKVGAVVDRLRGASLTVAAKGGDAVKTGGRLGKPETRQHIDDVATELERRGWMSTHGGNPSKRKGLRTCRASKSRSTPPTTICPRW